MLQIATWKRVLIWAVCAAGLWAAMPNLFYSRVEVHNDAAAAVAARGGDPTPAEAEAIARWPDLLPGTLVNLGLDLRGGAHLLAEVQLADVYAGRMDALWPEVRDALRAERAAIGSFNEGPSEPGTLRIALSNPEGMARALEIVQGMARPVVSLLGPSGNDLEVRAEGSEIIVTFSEAEQAATDERTMRQSLEIIRLRIDKVGTREPTIMRQGANRILIQVPGIGSAAELKALIGTTARLTFHPVVRTGVAGDAPGPRQIAVPASESAEIVYILEEMPVVTGNELTKALPAFDQNNRPAVEFRFNPTGARKFGDYTAANIGQPFAIVLDDEVISAPVIQSHIPGGSGIITGNFTVDGTTQLAAQLSAGALPARMEFLEERTIGPELGQDSIDAGRIAAVVSLLAVLVFMVASYGWFGVIANAALMLNIGLLFGMLSAIGATLTLPGIAGIVLTIGMAVDANVLVFERIREELKTARGPARAIELGYEKALSSIIDANLTTFLIAVILFAVGSGPVRGFSVTLGLGIFTSVFTAVFVTRLMVVTWFEWRRPKTLTV